MFVCLFLNYPVRYILQYSAWKMKVVFFIIVFTSSFSGWFGFKRSISVSSIIFLSVTLHKPDISDTIYVPQEGEKCEYCQKLVKTIFWPVVGLHVQDEQEMTQFLPSGSWYLIWVSEKWNFEGTKAHEQARRKSFSDSSAAQNWNLLFLFSTISWINRKAGFDISTFYVLLYDLLMPLNQRRYLWKKYIRDSVSIPLLSKKYLNDDLRKDKQNWMSRGKCKCKHYETGYFSNHTTQHFVELT